MHFAAHGRLAHLFSGNKWNAVIAINRPIQMRYVLLTVDGGWAA